MKNTRRFTRHCKHITLSGNVQFKHKDAYADYSRYPFETSRKELTRIQLIDSYAMVTRQLKGPDLILMIDGLKVREVVDEQRDVVHYVNDNTGELLLTLDYGYPEFASDWAKDVYRWGK